MIATLLLVLSLLGFGICKFFDSRSKKALFEERAKALRAFCEESGAPAKELPEWLAEHVDAGSENGRTALVALLAMDGNARERWLDILGGSQRLPR